ncbi:Ca-activated chloride channel family protein [Actinokineospora baliensis]|uniref:vWA domain-containing protein n=1 Tax=Actinokineospora baliensis TaxID=547056 RepID=UPI0019592687|nr:VWA domain-containing protein [Actinokineospora baliensis]MBM7774018.1 Ca-activated chloride channel family protein [Actinokineospora baliensis]
MIASSELSDVEPLLAGLREATGVELKMDYRGTLDASDAIVDGTAKSDLAWLASDKFLSLKLDELGKPRLPRESIAYSPVVFGIKRSVAQRLGWSSGARVTWGQIAAKAGADELTFGMASPDTSHSGFAAVLGAAAAFANTGAALQANQVDGAKLTDLFKGQMLTAGTSAWLVDTYVDDPAAVDGLVNYESVLTSLNASGKLAEPLDLVYPADGVTTADYPLLLLDQSKQDAYRKVVEYLRGATAQQDLTDRSFRRPTNRTVAANPRVAAVYAGELPFPANQDVVDELINAYRTTYRRPAHAIYVLDFSISMATGGRIEALRSAFANLSGADKSRLGRAAEFRDREKITIVPFAGAVQPEQTVVVDKDDPAPVTRINSLVESTPLTDGTAVWSALERAYVLAADSVATHDYLVSIVLMTDGDRNMGTELPALLDGLKALPEPVRHVRTFPIRFGEANASALNEIATLTGGKAFDARSDDELRRVFTEIRGYL